MENDILQETLRRSAGDKEMLLIDLSDQRFPRLFRQLLGHINQWDGNERGLVGMADRATAEKTIEVLRQAAAVRH